MKLFKYEIKGTQTIYDGREHHHIPVKTTVVASCSGEALQIASDRKNILAIRASELEESTESIGTMEPVVKVDNS
tara:strand:- start:344 stop:568 length:225 start_codon:yes stop_codon:yes gene_type:complete